MSFAASAGLDLVVPETEEEEDDDRDSIVSLPQVVDPTYTCLIKLVCDHFPESRPLASPPAPPHFTFEEFCHCGSSGILSAEAPGLSSCSKIVFQAHDGLRSWCWWPNRFIRSYRLSGICSLLLTVQITPFHDGLIRLLLG